MHKARIPEEVEAKRLEDLRVNGALPDLGRPRTVQGSLSIPDLLRLGIHRGRKGVDGSNSSSMLRRQINKLVEGALMAPPKSGDTSAWLFGLRLLAAQLREPLQGRGVVKAELAVKGCHLLVLQNVGSKGGRVSGGGFTFDLRKLDLGILPSVIARGVTVGNVKTGGSKVRGHMHRSRGRGRFGGGGGDSARSIATAATAPLSRKRAGAGRKSRSIRRRSPNGDRLGEDGGGGC
jgi:hypothetical protein